MAAKSVKFSFTRSDRGQGAALLPMLVVVGRVKELF